MPQRKRSKLLSDQIREAVVRCGVSCYRISKETGIGEATLSRFLGGSRGLPMKTLDVLAEYLQINIVVGGPKRAGRTRKDGGK